MLLLTFINEVILLNLVSLFYYTGIYIPYELATLYYPYVENHRSRSSPITMTEIEWLQHPSNYKFPYHCDNIIEQSDGCFFCFGCSMKRSSYSDGPLGKLPSDNKWIIPKIALSSNEHDTDAVYFLTPYQAYQHWKGDWGQILNEKFFFLPRSGERGILWAL